MLYWNTIGNFSSIFKIDRISVCMRWFKIIRISLVLPAQILRTRSNCNLLIILSTAITISTRRRRSWNYSSKSEIIFFFNVDPRSFYILLVLRFMKIEYYYRLLLSLKLSLKEQSLAFLQKVMFTEKPNPWRSHWKYWKYNWRWDQIVPGTSGQDYPKNFILSGDLEPPSNPPPTTTRMAPVTKPYWQVISG